MPQIQRQTQIERMKLYVTWYSKPVWEVIVSRSKGWLCVLRYGRHVDGGVGKSQAVVVVVTLHARYFVDHKNRVALGPLLVMVREWGVED